MAFPAVLICLGIGTVLGCVDASRGVDVHVASRILVAIEANEVTVDDLGRILGFDSDEQRQFVDGLRGAVARRPGDGNLAYVLWKVLLSTGDPEEAAAVAAGWVRALHEEPRAARMAITEAARSHLLALGTLWEARARLREQTPEATRLAIPVLEQAARIADEVPVKHALSREYLFMAGDVRPHPALVARYALAEALETDGQEGKSLATYQEFVRLCPKYYTWTVCLKHKRDLHTTLAEGKGTLKAQRTELDVLDFERWKAGDPFVRGQIAGPLAYSDALIGLTQAEVLDRLGPADESFEARLEYRIANLGYETEADLPRYGDVFLNLWHSFPTVEMLRPDSPLQDFPQLPRLYLLEVDLSEGRVTRVSISRDPKNEPQIDHRRYDEAVFLAIVEDRLDSGTPEEVAQVVAKLETRLGSEAASKPYSDADALAIRRFGAGQASEPGDAILDRAAQYWQFIVRKELKEALANLGLHWRASPTQTSLDPPGRGCNKTQPRSVR